MSDEYEDFWAKPPEKAVHPTRVKMLEGLLRTGEPLSARQLVDVLDGEVSMWEAARHLSELEALGVVERTDGGTGEERPRPDDFDVPHRLVDQETEEDDRGQGEDEDE